MSTPKLSTSARFLTAVQNAIKLSAEFAAVTIKVAEVRQLGSSRVIGYVLFITCVPTVDEDGQFIYQEVGRFQGGNLVERQERSFRSAGKAAEELGMAA